MHCRVVRRLQLRLRTRHALPPEQEIHFVQPLGKFLKRLDSVNVLNLSDKFGQWNCVILRDSCKLADLRFLS